MYGDHFHVAPGHRWAGQLDSRRAFASCGAGGGSLPCRTTARAAPKTGAPGKGVFSVNHHRTKGVSTHSTHSTRSARLKSSENCRFSSGPGGQGFRPEGRQQGLVSHTVSWEALLSDAGSYLPNNWRGTMGSSTTRCRAEQLATPQSGAERRGGALPASADASADASAGSITCPKRDPRKEAAARRKSAAHCQNGTQGIRGNAAGDLHPHGGSQGIKTALPLPSLVNRARLK